MQHELSQAKEPNRQIGRSDQARLRPHVVRKIASWNATPCNLHTHVPSPHSTCFFLSHCFGSPDKRVDVGISSYQDVLQVLRVASKRCKAADMAFRTHCKCSSFSECPDPETRRSSIHAAPQLFAHPANLFIVPSYTTYQGA